ncbi:aquaporin family protein [Paracraurococcus ruber]|uniref:Aquaporin family protein n=2 Tax=Paracraurococcus ruber TaxID=77675 RepID=A0ABS1CVQ2_9PROT|nr:aquaporin family protein [Paracraurococcus ruber]TDG31745.1 aquaporin family protein [Paracraurococcus ruber]
MAGLPRRLAAEALGTAWLLAVVVGSGIMAERLSGGSTGLALLANAVATGAALPVIILVFAPLSGAHLNPAVSLVMALRREIAARDAGLYMLAQAAGGILGVALAHAMFEHPALLEAGTRARTGGAQWLAEGVATAGLVLAILGVRRAMATAVPFAVGLYIVAAYWFTASTSFANPAVTLARGFTTSFAGIAPADVAGFALAQCAGALLAAGLWRWLEVPSQSGVRGQAIAPAGVEGSR